MQRLRKLRILAFVLISILLLSLPSAAGPKLPRDDDAVGVQVLSPVGNIANLNFTSTTSSVAIPTGAKIVRVAATQNCYYKLGDSSIVATTSDVLLLQGIEYISVPQGITYIAAIRDSADGKLNVVEMK